MSDLVKRLRRFVDDPNYGILGIACVAMGEAAARIEALEARVFLLEGYLGGALNVIEQTVACDTSDARAALTSEPQTA